MSADYVISPPPQPTIAVAGTSKVFPVRRIWCVGRLGEEERRRRNNVVRAHEMAVGILRFKGNARSRDTAAGPWMAVGLSGGGHRRQRAKACGQGFWSGPKMSPPLRPA